MQFQFCLICNTVNMLQVPTCKNCLIEFKEINRKSISIIDTDICFYLAENNVFCCSNPLYRKISDLFPSLIKCVNCNKTI